MKKLFSVVINFVSLRFHEGFGEQGNIGKISKGKGSMSLFLGSRGTKLYKLENENMVSKFIKRGEQIRKTCRNMETSGNFGREEGPLPGRPSFMYQ